MTRFTSPGWVYREGREGGFCVLGDVRCVAPRGPASHARAGDAPTCEKLRDRATIVGTNGPDVIHGRNNRDDIIFAKGGNDRIWGHGGFSDTICTGPGR